MLTSPFFLPHLNKGLGLDSLLLLGTYCEVGKESPSYFLDPRGLKAHHAGPHSQGF